MEVRVDSWFYFPIRARVLNLGLVSEVMSLWETMSVCVFMYI